MKVCNGRVLTANSSVRYGDQRPGGGCCNPSPRELGPLVDVFPPTQQI